MRFLRQSTAVEEKVGPFLDETDGKTVEDALTISQADVTLAKNGGDWAQKNEATSLVHESQGWYRCLLDTTDTNTLGTLILKVHESGALPVWVEYSVIPAGVYDWLFGTNAYLPDNSIRAATIATDSLTADKIAADAIGASEIAASAIGASEIATDAIDADAIAADAIGASEIAASAIGASEIAGDAITAAKIATDAITSDEIAASAATEIGAEAGMTITRSTGALIGTSETVGLTVGAGITRTENEVDLLADNTSRGKARFYLVFNGSPTQGDVKVAVRSGRLSGQWYQNPEMTWTVPAARAGDKVWLGEAEVGRYASAQITNRTDVDLANVALLYELVKEG